MEAAATMGALGLAEHPLAPRLQRRLVDVECELERLRHYLDGKGRYSNKGDPRPAYTLYLDLQRSDRAELRALVDKLAEIAAASGSGGAQTVPQVNFLPVPGVKADGTTEPAYAPTGTEADDPCTRP